MCPWFNSKRYHSSFHLEDCSRKRQSSSFFICTTFSPTYKNKQTKHIKMNKKRIISITLFFMLSWAMAVSNEYDKYYQNLPIPMSAPTLPTIPDNRVSLPDFGGKGDGVTMNTEAFGTAMSELSKKGGGHLDVPAGVYLTGMISFKDNIDLHLDKNAIIVLSPDKNDFIKIENGMKDDKATPGINASKRKNISITGEGIIDGNGEWWRPVKRGKVSDTEWNRLKAMGGTVTPKGDLWYPFNLTHFSNVADTYETQERYRPHLVRFTDCENVLVKGVTLLNSPKFHIIPTRCTNVVIDGITVKCPWNAQNGDAIDISSCRQVLIVNNVIDAGDDGICMKAGAGAKGVEYGPVANVLIENNTVYNAHGGFVIGSEFSGGMKNIVVRRNKFCGTDTGLRFKSAVKRGGKTENIFISDIYMTDIKNEAIVFETTYWDNHVGAKKAAAPIKAEYVPEFQDIYISNIICRGAKTGITAHGERGMIHHITIENSCIFYTDKSTDIDANSDIKLTNVRLLTFENRQ